jgi:hypothetical protein
MSMDLNSKFERLIKGQIVYKSDIIGLNLLISRLQKKYTANQTALELKSCMEEMSKFFEKYTSFTRKDAEAISNL